MRGDPVSPRFEEERFSFLDAGKAFLFYRDEAGKEPPSFEGS